MYQVLPNLHYILLLNIYKHCVRYTPYYSRYFISMYDDFL